MTPGTTASRIVKPAVDLSVTVKSRGPRVPFLSPRASGARNYAIAPFTLRFFQFSQELNHRRQDEQRLDAAG
jgi:hypothetical protein